MAFKYLITGTFRDVKSLEWLFFKNVKICCQEKRKLLYLIIYLFSDESFEKFSKFANI